MLVKSLDTPTFKHPNPLYSSYTSVPLSPTTELITVAGQVAEDPVTNAVPEGLPAQIDLCLSRISIILDHAGATRRDLTRFMYYIAQPAIDKFDAKEGEGSALKLIGGKVGTWLEGHRPASCYMRVFGMSEDKYCCEFECMAVVTKKE